MNEQANTKIVQQAYENFRRGDIPALLGLLSPDVEWRLPEIENMALGDNNARGCCATSKQKLKSE